MKNALMGFLMILLLFLSGIFMFIVNGKENRKNELDESLATAIEQSLQTMAVLESYTMDRENSEHLIADSIQSAMYPLTSNADIEVRVLSLDAGKGFLDVEAVEHYKNIVGIGGTVKSRKAAVLEDYSIPEESYYMVTFKGISATDPSQVVTYSTLSIYYGGAIALPQTPAAPGYVFDGWVMEGDPSWDGDFSHLTVKKDLVFQAKFHAA